MKIALVSDDFSLWVFRRGLISELLKRGDSIYVICSSSGYVYLLEEMGAKHISVEFERFINPLKDFWAFGHFFNIFCREKFDIVHTFTIKPNILAAIAAKLAKTKRVILSVTGLGILKNDDDGQKMRVLSGILRMLYKLAGLMSTNVWFQNADDMAYFTNHKILPHEKAVLIKSSGVNLDEFSPESINNQIRDSLKEEIGGSSLTKYVTMVTRPLWSKGVREFIDAADIINKKYPDVLFLLVGGIEDGNPNSVPENYLKEKESPSFKWIGFKNEVREIQAITDIAVLPSFYAEGIPRNLLEAMAMGNPIVTTDNVGCKEVVEDGKNGYLVPIKNAGALAVAVENLIVDEDKSKQFGRYSRALVEKKFDEKIVINRVMSELYQ